FRGVAVRVGCGGSDILLRQAACGHGGEARVPVGVREDRRRAQVGFALTVILALEEVAPAAVGVEVEREGGVGLEGLAVESTRIERARDQGPGAGACGRGQY